MTAEDPQPLRAAIAALEAQRALLGDAVVEAALGPLRERLSQLQHQATPRGQALRQVSVLFLDVVGSTRLAQRLDPEQIHELVDGLLRRCTGVVAEHGGRVRNQSAAVPVPGIQLRLGASFVRPIRAARGAGHAPAHDPGVQLVRLS